MALAFDASVESVRTGTNTPQTWSHPPVGIVRAMVVAVVHGTSATDHISALSCGGVAMVRQIRATDTAGEPGASELWFLGSGIPTGTLTMSATCGTTTDDIHFVSMSFTAAADTEVIDTDSKGQDQANPSVTLQYGGRSALAVAALYGGGSAPTAFTPNANCTAVQDNDFGAFYSTVIRQTTAGTADFTIGGTATSDDVAFTALAFSEVAATTVTPGVGAVVAIGFAPTVTASSGGGGMYYTTTFPTDEDPISEGGTWLDGAVVGLDWTGVYTSGGNALGKTPSGGGDAVAIHSGTWGNDQEVTATVYQVSPPAGKDQEVELRVRSSLSAHVNTGYVASITSNPIGEDGNAIIGRFDGAGVFTWINGIAGPTAAAHAGDVISFSAIGTALSLKVNGTEILAWTDSTYSGGAPGFGFYWQTGDGPTTDYGFSDWTATDTPGSPTVAPGVGAATVSGFAPTIVASGNKLVTAGLAALSLAGFAPTVTVSGPPTVRTYTTTFAATEDPLSEGGNWINGGTDGLDWTDCVSAGGYAHGHVMVADGHFRDPTALLTGTWGPDQRASATVYQASAVAGSVAEVELRLRSTISAHVNSGYELLFRSTTPGDSAAVCELVRWNGALDDYTVLDSNYGAASGVQDGDIVSATIVGTTIKGYINGVEKLSATDSTYATGAPGIGFYWEDGAATPPPVTDYGFKDYTVTDGIGAQPGTGAVTVTGFAPTITVSANQTVTPGAGVLNAAGFAPTVTASNHQTVTPGTGLLTASGLAPTILTPVTVQPAVGAITVAGLAPTVLAGGTAAVTPGPAAVTLTGFAPVLAVGGNQVVSPDPGVLALAGLAPTVTASNHQTVTPGTGALLVTGFAPTIAAGGSQVVTPGTGVVQLAGFAPSIGGSATVSPGTGALVSTGFAPVIVARSAAALYQITCTSGPRLRATSTSGPRLIAQRSNP